MNLVREPSFELGGRYWTLSTHAAVRSDVGARTGVRALSLLVARWSIGGPIERSSASQAIATLPGKRYRASAWVLPSGAPECTVRLRVASPSTAAPVLLGSASAGGDSWTELSGTYVAAGEDSLLLLDVIESPGLGTWLVDDASLELVMASRRDEIRQALLSALSGIDGNAPYETAPKEVLGYARTPLAYPAIHISGEEETRDLRGYKAVTATVSYDVVAITGRFDSEDKVEELDKLIADVERAIGQDPTLGLPEYGVHAVISEVHVARGLDGEIGGMAVLKVETPYRFGRGEP